MDPPPSSLQAMIRNQPGAFLTPPRGRGPWWLVVLVLALLVLAYYFGLRH